MTLHVATFAQLSPATLYALLKLRMEVFVVEQRSPYLDIDGRDTEPGTRHVWYTAGEVPVAYLRMLAEPAGTVRIGRVCVAAAARGTGLARRLMRDALELIGPGPSVLDAQTYLAGFYAGLGYTPSGPPFVEDGIPHVPMRRPGDGPPAAAAGGPATAGTGEPAPAQGSAATSSVADRRRPV